MKTFLARLASFVLLFSSFVLAEERPNIVLIMCDDMGYSDLGCYGSEIKTPHLDSLAEGGFRFSHFRNTGRCCPSRASLLTGRHQHAVGMGWMTAVDEYRPGYRGQISSEVPTLAELLKEQGYSTYMSGKWHLTVDGAWKPEGSTPNGSYPTDRGFDEFYGSLSGGGNYYRPKGVRRNETSITEFPDDYYYTEAIDEHAVGFLKDHDTTMPFFLYLAHYAPHRPLQAPKERVDACRKRYAVGYDALREARFEALQQLSLIQPDPALPVHHREYRKEERPSWDSLDSETQEKWITEMATYAAMIEIMDEGIGEIIEEIKSKGEFDNTLFIFLSDNGATNEGGLVSQLAAELSNTPFRSYKSKTFMGGISSPLIVHYPKVLKKNGSGIVSTPTHITDILPTCLDLAGATYPETFKGADLLQPDGISIVPALNGKPLPERDFFFEHQTACAVISGDWKLVRAGQGWAWELINLKDDPFEQKNLAKSHPEKVAELEKKWMQWADENCVLPLSPSGLSWNKRIDKYTELNPDQNGWEE